MDGFAKREFNTVVIGGFMLSNTAGYINAVSLAGLFSAPVSHVTGNLTKVSLSLLQGQWKSLGVYSSITFSFMLGSMVSGYMMEASKFQLGRRYGIALLLESGALMLGAILLNFEMMLGEAVLAFACGLQNAMASSYSGAVLRTTHMTGITTDIGILLGQLVAHRDQVEVWKLKVFVPLAVGYLTGGLLGGVAFTLVGVRSLMLPSAVTFAIALFYLTWEPAREARVALQSAMKKLQTEVEMGVRRVALPIRDLAKTGAATFIPRMSHAHSAHDLSRTGAIPVYYPESATESPVPIDLQIQDLIQSMQDHPSTTPVKAPVSRRTAASLESSSQDDESGSQDKLLQDPSKSSLNGVDPADKPDFFAKRQ